LYGIFVADKKDVDILLLNKVELDFGEALGKHSQIQGVLNSEDIIFASDDPMLVDLFEQQHLSSGINPFTTSVSGEELTKYNLPDDSTAQDVVDYLKASYSKVILDT